MRPSIARARFANRTSVRPQLGTLHAEDEGVGLRFEHHYGVTPSEVWAALAEPESIRRWLLADAVLEPRVGGAFSLNWSGGEEAHGQVRLWEPPSVFEVDWNEPALRSILHIEIAAAESGSTLVLDHRNVTSEASIGMGAGWHAHLELLSELVEGGDPTAERWQPRSESLRPEYEQLVAARPS